MITLHIRTAVAGDPASIAAWFARPATLRRLLPPDGRVRLGTHQDSGTGLGVLRLSLPWGLFRRRWNLHLRHPDATSVEATQVRGPFTQWQLRVALTSAEQPGQCHLDGTLSYVLPRAAVSRLWAGRVHAAMRRWMAFLERRCRDDLERQQALSSKRPRLHIAISGASGLIGEAVAGFLASGGHTVSSLVRRAARPGHNEIAWDPQRGTLDATAADGCDAVVHLAGENVAGGRWSAERRARIRDSRVEPTRRLCAALAALPHPPRVLIVASGINYYGSGAGAPAPAPGAGPPAGPPAWDETSPMGTGFLAEVCRDWEAACAPAADAGMRVVSLRIGMVLAAQGGALAHMLPLFRAGLGGVLGDGRQWISWIALDDMVGAIAHLLTAAVHGPVNAVAAAVTNRDFTRILARTLHRYAPWPVPATLIRLLLGEMGEELLLSSVRAEPARLLGSGFRFACPTLEQALASELDLERTAAGTP